MFCNLFSLNITFQTVNINIFNSSSFILDFFFFFGIPITHDSFIWLMKYLLSIYYIPGSNLRQRGHSQQLNRQEGCGHEADSLGVKIPMSASFF